MLSIERILEISKQNGVSISKETNGVHYISDNKNNKVPFDTTMLIKVENQAILQEYSFDYNKECFSYDMNRIYKAESSDKPLYQEKPMDISESNVLAA